MRTIRIMSVYYPSSVRLDFVHIVLRAGEGGALVCKQEMWWLRKYCYYRLITYSTLGRGEEGVLSFLPLHC